jgi:hypothetical protein
MCDPEKRGFEMAATVKKPTDITGLAAGSLAVVWIVTYFVARLAIEVLSPGSPMRLAVVLLPIVPFAGLLWFFIRGVRGADELERRIHLEALAVAFPLSVLMLMVLGLLDLAIDLDPDNWSYRHLWPFMFVFWFLGLAAARRRYS